MASDLQRNFNHARFDPASGAGFYESYFQRANHPARPLAFWIRYTLFSPKGHPDAAIGELWAVWFDGERGRNVACKAEVPAGDFAFARDRLEARIGQATLVPAALRGAAESRGHRVEWDLGWSGGQALARLMPEAMYEGGFPQAKSLVGVPMARYRGALVVDGERHAIEDWVGSQNHNWGVRHTDRYAYGQVCGFDTAPESFLEIATAQVRIGPLRTPRMTPALLRHDGREYAVRSLAGSILRTHARYGYFHWDFSLRGKDFDIAARIEAPRERFVGLRYYNPPGGEKACLNTKLASCRLVLRRPGQADAVLETRHRAAFEILTDDDSHGLELRT